MDIKTTPIEAGFGEMLKINNDRQFPGCKQLRNNSKTKQIVGIIIKGRRAAREGATIKLDGKIIGKVSSGAFSPSLGIAIAIAFLDPHISLQSGLEIELDIGRVTIMGKITTMPFYKNSTVRLKL